MKVSTRREFLSASAAAALLLGAGAGSAVAFAGSNAPRNKPSNPSNSAIGIKKRRGPVRLEDLNRSTFEAAVGSDFRIQPAESAAFDARLVEASPLRRAVNEGQFSLLFLAPPSQDLPQDTYRMRHKTIGEFALFLVPIRSGRDGVCYEAVFNRIHG